MKKNIIIFLILMIFNNLCFSDSPCFDKTIISNIEKKYGDFVNSLYNEEYKEIRCFYNDFSPIYFSENYNVDFFIGKNKNISLKINSNDYRINSIYVEMNELKNESKNKNVIREKILNFLKNQRKEIDFNNFELLINSKKNPVINHKRWSFKYNGILSTDTLRYIEFFIRPDSNEGDMGYSLYGCFKEPVNKLGIKRKKAVEEVKKYLKKQQKAFLKIINITDNDSFEICDSISDESTKFSTYDITNPIVVWPNYLFLNRFLKLFVKEYKILSGINENRFAWVINTKIIKRTENKKIERNLIFFVDTQTSEIIGGEYLYYKDDYIEGFTLLN